MSPMLFFQGKLSGCNSFCLRAHAMAAGARQPEVQSGFAVFPEAEASPIGLEP